jgi:acyl-CoA dehydrogenase
LSLPESLDSPEQSLRHLVETELKPHDAAIEETGEIPPQALDPIRSFGLYWSNTPKRYGKEGGTP